MTKTTAAKSRSRPRAGMPAPARGTEAPSTVELVHHTREDGDLRFQSIGMLQPRPHPDNPEDTLWYLRQNDSQIPLPSMPAWVKEALSNPPLGPAPPMPSLEKEEKANRKRARRLRTTTRSGSAAEPAEPAPAAPCEPDQPSSEPVAAEGHSVTEWAPKCGCPPLAQKLQAQPRALRLYQLQLKLFRPLPPQRLKHICLVL